MKIKDVCKLTGLTDRAIRHYIDMGLLEPECHENYAGRKSFEFSEEDIIILKKIVIYRRAGISIPDIQDIFKGNLELSDALAKTADSLSHEYDNINVSMFINDDLAQGGYTNDNIDIDKYWDENYKPDPLKELTEKARRNLKFSIIVSAILFVALIGNTLFDCMNGKLQDTSDIIFRTLFVLIASILLFVFIRYCYKTLKSFDNK